MEEFAGAGVFFEVGELGEPVVDIRPLEAAAAGGEEGADLGFHARAEAEEQEEEPVFGAEEGDFVDGDGAREHGFFKGEAGEDVAEAKSRGVLGEDLAEAAGVGFRGGEQVARDVGFFAEVARNENLQFVNGAGSSPMMLGEGTAEGVAGKFLAEGLADLLGAEEGVSEFQKLSSR